MNGDVTCVHKTWPSDITFGTYFIKSSVDVLDDDNSSGLIIILTFFEFKRLLIFTTSGSFVDTKIESINLQSMSCSSLILQSPPWIPEKVFVFFLGC